MTAQAKHIFEKASETGEENSRHLQDTYLRAAQGSIEYQQKALSMAKSHFDAAFDCAHQLLAAKSPSEFIEVSLNHARRQFEPITEQTRELASIAQQAATTSIEPLTNGVTGAFRRTME